MVKGQHQCPICRRAMPGSLATQAAEWPQYPFCSPKCKLVDLGRWMDGSYAQALQREPTPGPESEPSDDGA